jgi:ribosomal protein S18 acetylase RimI-like enzyme
MPATVELRPMTPAEFERFTDGVIADYAAQNVLSGAEPADTAVAQARDETEKLLPDGVRTANMLLLTAVDGRQQVGSLWLSLPSAHRTLAWVYMVLVDPAHRGHGYGRAIMLAAEGELVSRGVTELGLNVFGHNTVARRLYEDIGYEVTAQQMAKKLS